MKVTAWKNNVKEGLDITERAIAKSSSLPILQNISFVAKKDFVEMSSTDLQMGIIYGFPAKVVQGGQCIFAGRFLSSLLGVFPEEQISLQLSEKNLLVSFGAHETIVPTLDPEEFPIIPSVDKGDTFVEVETSTWCKGLSQVVSMAGQSQTRPEISGVLVVLERKTIKLVATDSFRLAEKTIPLDAEPGAIQSFIVPQKTARELISVLAERPGKTKIYPSPTQVVFGYTSEEESFQAQIKVVSRLVEGEYPRYEDVIPTTEKTKVELSRAELLNNIRAAGIFAGKTNEVRLKVQPAKKQIAFFSENSEAGKHTAALKANVAGEEVEVGFNWRFLADGLAQVKGDSVEFGLNGEDGPALLEGTAHEGYRYVLMPIKA